MTEDNSILQGQLTLLRHLYEKGLLDETVYRTQLQAFGVNPGNIHLPSPPAQPLADLRVRLDFLDDPQVDALALDQFPEVYSRFSRGMRLDEKVNLLLDHCRRHPDAMAALVEWLDRQLDKGNSTDALACYLTHVVESNRRLQLQGIRSASGLVSIALEEIYITLTATVRRMVGDEEAGVEETARLASGEVKRLGLDRPRESVQQVKVAVQEALATSPRLVVLGDPGSGKTTLLRYLALTYARDWRELPGLVKERLELDERRLPVLLPLRDLARYLEKKHPDVIADGPKLLLDYLRLYFQNQQLALPSDFFQTRLEAGECTVLLDGVDEVASLPTRHRVSRLVERFTLTYPCNRYVVTSRIVGYTGGAWLGADYAVTTVRDFTDADVERFVQGWNRAVEVVLADGATSYALREADRQSEVLLSAIRTNERVRELAVNPLLLTVIALVQRYRAALPERRVELYEEAIEVLLAQWDAVKGLSATAVLQGLELDAGDRRALLEPVALWMMEHRQREIDLDDLRRQLALPFLGLLKDQRLADKAVDGFVHLINERSGLLTERGEGVYAFSHLTFQEHLAARAIADRDDYLAYTLARLGDSWWRQVALLEVGYLSTQGKRRATELVRAMMDHKDEPEPYHNLVLAAEAVRDVGQARLEIDLAAEIQRRLYKAFETPLRSWVRELPALVHRRATAAEALARIESGAFGAQPAFWRLPYGEPMWVEVPGGEFWMGGEMYDDEKPVHRVRLDHFWIARTPVTNAQYQLFVEATSSRPPDHWENGHPPKGKESHPVVYVSWHDALAYCQWLSEAVGKAITLPSEAEWEKAARGDSDKREYPWGKWQQGRANTAELVLGNTTPVGIFLDGSSPYGALDLSGNVLEWTRSLWGPRDEKRRTTVLKFPYPYDPVDGRENMEAGDDVRRVLRGGCFFSSQFYARCAYRRSGDPLFRGEYDGFRVVISHLRSAL